MLWWLVAPALAAELSRMGVGGRLVVPDTLSPAGGFTLGSVNEDVAIWTVFGEKVAGDVSAVKAWRVEAGLWGPLASDPEDSVPSRMPVALPVDAQGESPAEAPPPERPDFVQATPHFAFGGDTWRDERFTADLDVYALFDFPALAGVDESVFYAGPAVGGGLGIAYPRGGGAGAGGVSLAGGAFVGVYVAEAFFTRVRALADVDPFVAGGGELEGAAIIGASLARAGAPVAVTVGGEAARSWARDAPLRWQANATLQYVLDD